MCPRWFPALHFFYQRLGVASYDFPLTNTFIDDSRKLDAYVTMSGHRLLVYSLRRNPAIHTAQMTKKRAKRRYQDEVAGAVDRHTSAGIGFL